MGGVKSEVWEWRKNIVDLHTSVRVAFAIVYGTMHVIYYLTKHENVAKSIWKIIKFSANLSCWLYFYYVGLQFYSFASGGVLGVTIALIVVYFLISPYLYFKYFSEDDKMLMGSVSITGRLVALSNLSYVVEQSYTE